MKDITGPFGDKPVDKNALIYGVRIACKKHGLSALYTNGGGYFE